MLLIPVGLFFTLYGFRFLSAKPGADPRVDEFHKKWGVFFRVAGPLIVAYGVFQVVAQNVQGGGP